MKLIVFCFSLFSTIVYSQQKEKNDIRTGFKGGWVTSTEVLDWKGGNSATASVDNFYLSIYNEHELLSGFLGLSYELAFKRLGSITTGNFGIETKTRLNYLQLPLALHANLGPFYVKGGVYGAWLMVARDIVGKEKTKVKPLKDNYDILDWGVTVGAGLKFKHFGLDISYNMGLQKINKRIAPSLPTQNYNASLDLGLAIYF